MPGSSFLRVEGSLVGVASCGVWGATACTYSLESLGLEFFLRLGVGILHSIEKATQLVHGTPRLAASQRTCSVATGVRQRMRPGKATIIGEGRLTFRAWQVYAADKAQVSHMKSKGIQAHHQKRGVPCVMYVCELPHCTTNPDKPRCRGSPASRVVEAEHNIKRPAAKRTSQARDARCLLPD